ASRSRVLAFLFAFSSFTHTASRISKGVSIQLSVIAVREKARTVECSRLPYRLGRQTSASANLRTSSEVLGRCSSEWLGQTQSDQEHRPPCFPLLLLQLCRRSGYERVSSSRAIVPSGNTSGGSRGG